MIEVEVKLPVRELEEIKKQLMQNGFAETAHLRERDTYFDNVAGRILLFCFWVYNKNIC